MKKKKSRESKSKNEKKISMINGLEMLQLTGPAGERSDQTEDRVMRVTIGDLHVQVVQAAAENIHDAGGEFTEIGVLGFFVRKWGVVGSLDGDIP